MEYAPTYSINREVFGETEIDCEITQFLGDSNRWVSLKDNFFTLLCKSLFGLCSEEDIE